METGRAGVATYAIIKEEVEEFVPSQQACACEVNPQQ
jgi:hypothetical protein